MDIGIDAGLVEPKADVNGAGATVSAPPRSWVVAYGNLGLINIVAESQEALVGMINTARMTAATLSGDLVGPLVPVHVLQHNGSREPATIWIDPLLVEAVLDETKPRAAGAQGVEVPPGLQSMLESLRSGVAETQTVEVVVEPEVEAEPEAQVGPPAKDDDSS